jgi:16S rRNA (adenine1518-N6/adenine1519-N6)-dimethyltransferase
MQHDQLHALLSKYHLRPDKELGQHYLIDEAILDATIAAAEIKEGELVVEIGAGPGILTSALAQAGADVLAIEFARDFCRLLQSEYHNWRNVHVLCDDALRIDFAKLEKDSQPYAKMVANIPYQITNPLVRKILSPGSPIRTAVLMIQKEVADRLIAKPGSSDRGLLTIMVEYYGAIEKVTDVPASSFWPSPKVESSVVKITRQPDNQTTRQPDNEPAFFWFVKQGLSSKRKTLINSLAAGLQKTKAETAAIVEEAQIDPLARAEDLTLEQWLNLFSIYQGRMM